MNCPLEAAHQTLDLPQSTSHTCAVPMVPLGHQRIVLPYHVLFRTLYINMEAIKSNPYVLTLEPSALWACLDYVVIHIRNSIILPLWNLTSKIHYWYPIFPWKRLAHSSDSAKERIKRIITCPIWSIAPPGYVLSIFLLIKGTFLCGIRRN